MNAWGVEDKKRFLMAVKKYGTKNVIGIQKEMPDKSISEIRYICDRYSKCAYNRQIQAKKDKDYKDAPINEWIEIFKILHTKQGVEDIIPRVLKYIALFEQRIHDKDVDLRNCYLALSDLANGNHMKTLNIKTNYFLQKNLKYLANAFKTNEALQPKINFLKDLKNIDEPKTYTKCYGNKKKLLQNNLILNPLKIPIELLKMKENDEGEDDIEDEL